MADSSFEATLDTDLSELNPDTNYGSADPISVGVLGAKTADIKRLLLRFDISSIPLGSTITAASLDLRVIGGTGVSEAYTVYRLTELGWTEAGATWNKYDGSNTWAAGGGDYTATDKNQFTGPAGVGDFVVSDMATLVQDALDNRSRQLDVILTKDDEVTKPRNFAINSIEQATAEYRPELDVTYDTTQIASPSGIASAEAFGTPTLPLIPPGIASVEAFGVPTVAHLVPGGIASVEVFGAPQVNLGIATTGIASVEAFGTLTLTKIREAVYTSTIFNPLQYANRVLHVKSSGDRYAIIPDGAAAMTELNCLKNSADPWEKQDDANRPTGEDAITGVYSDLDSTGVIHIVWQTFGATKRTRYVTFDTSDDTWGTVETVRTSTTDAFLAKASLSLDSNDKPHVVFIDNSGPREVVFYTEKTGASWSARALVSDGAGFDVINASLYLDSADDVHVFWTKARELYYRKMTSGSWGSIETVEAADVATTLTGYLSIAVDGNDVPAVLWWELDESPDPDIWRFYFSKSLGGGSWSKIQVFTFEQPAGSLEWGSDLLFADNNWVISHVDGQVYPTADLFLRRSPSGTGFGASTEISTDRGWDWSRLCYGRNQQHGTYLEMLIESVKDVYWERYLIADVAGPFTLETTGIASAEAFGTPQIDLTAPVTGIASVEAFGIPVIVIEVPLSGISSVEAFGSPVVAGPITATGIASVEAFGAVTLPLIPDGIASSEAFGTLVVAGPLTVPGIVSSESFGTAIIAGPITSIGIASAEAFGTLTLIINVSPGGIVEGITNLIINPSFEVDLAGWTSAGSGVFTRETGGAKVGSARAQLTSAGVSVYVLVAHGSGGITDRFPVFPDSEYSFQGWIKTTKDSGWITQLRFYDSGGGQVGFITDTVLVAEAEGWVKTSASMVAPPTAAVCALAILDVGGIFWDEEPEKVHIDAFMLYKGALSSAPNHIDGAQTDCEWLGAAHASRSVWTQVLGVPVVTGAITVAGIASAEAFGSLQVNLSIAGTGIASAEAFGTPTLTTGAVTASPAGIASSETFGTPTVSEPTATQTLSLTGVASEEALGSLVVAGPVSVSSIASAEAHGTPSLTTGAVSVSPSGIASMEAFGTPTTVHIVAPAGIASLETFSTPELTVGGPQGVLPPAISSLEAFGVPLVAGPITVLSGIASTETFGAPVFVGSVNPGAIASAEVFGVAAVLLSSLETLYPTGIASLEAVGSHTVEPVLHGMGLGYPALPPASARTTVVPSRGRGSFGTPPPGAAKET